MSQSTPPVFNTQRGFATPSVRQFSVFLDNRVGKLYELLEVFDDRSDVQICGLSVVDSNDHAVVRLIPNNSTIARKLLRERGLSFSETNLLVVEISEGHSLTTLCLYLLGAELSILFAYPLMFRSRSTPTIALAVDDQVLAGSILRSKNYQLLGEADLPMPGVEQE